MSGTHAALHPTFGVLPGLLEDGSRMPPPPEKGERTRAAVSLILRPREETEVLLIRRAEAPGDPWSGQMALPGGRWEEGDRDLKATAIRETMEETALDLDAQCAALGTLSPLSPSTYRLPPLTIHPFVFGVPGDTPARVASREVAEVLWAPLGALAHPDAMGLVEIPLGDISREFPCIRFRERVIWGLTFRILTEFFRRVEKGAPQLLAGV